MKNARNEISKEFEILHGESGRLILAACVIRLMHDWDFVVLTSFLSDLFDDFIENCTLFIDLH